MNYILKNTVMILTVLFISSPSLATVQYSMNEGKNTTNIGFSLHNKGSHAIYIDVRNEKGLEKAGNFLKNLVQKEADTVLKDRFLDKPIDISKDTTLIIYNKDGKEIYKATFTKNKTIYINWDGSKLYPQRGPLKGLTKATDAGYSLRKNVIQSDIRPL